MNPKLSIILLVAIICLSGCGTRPYTPTEYKLRDGVIPLLSVAGDTSIINGLSETNKVRVYEFIGVNLTSNYKDITQLMVDQAKKELAKNTQTKTAGKPKTIEIQVTYLKSEYQMMWWKSELRYTAVLGGSEKIEKVVRHGSGQVIQDLNGCIADAVVDLLKDIKVVAYLAE
ncbi:hypothetical protein [Ereboglobus luteus]|uniref:Uncharacterized protein n=1 Tax=Ereboglobus luteus TaxID=1796921 RepID=A0A2U8E2D4_9BACT|nr:hypothetical protein [Ereboglobus luteus]AWI08955.1 hypothetical protein CKA38_06560 [Ereboglobus luteus]